jgi:hypothetical protein
MKTETQMREEIEGLRNLTTAQLKEKLPRGVQRGVPIQSQAVPVPTHRLAHPGQRVERSVRKRPPTRARDCGRRRSPNLNAQELPAGADRQWLDPGNVPEAVARSTVGVARHAAHPPLSEQRHIIVHVRPDGGFECNGRIREALQRSARPRGGDRRRDRGNVDEAAPAKRINNLSPRADAPSAPSTGPTHRMRRGPLLRDAQRVPPAAVYLQRNFARLQPMVSRRPATSSATRRYRTW